MTLSTEVRINWPVPAVDLLNHVTRAAGGDPATVRRRTDGTWVGNLPMQGLRTLAWVSWSEQPDSGDKDWPLPPALVILCVDNPYGDGGRGRSGRWVQANEILPAVADWLDEQGVLRESWWWEDETAGTYHPGTCDVRLLDSNGERETWTPLSAGVD